MTLSQRFWKCVARYALRHAGPQPPSTRAVTITPITVTTGAPSVAHYPPNQIRFDNTWGAA